MTPVETLTELIIPRLDLERVYADIEFFRRTGQWWRGPCPLHGGDGPNFAVHVSTLRYHCHSRCGGGSVIDYVNGGRPARGSDWHAALAKLATLAGVELSEDLAGGDREESGDGACTDRILECTVALARRHLRSPSGADAREYLRSRVPDHVDLQDLEIGLMPPRDEVRKYLLSAGFSDDEIEQSHVLHDGRWPGRMIGTWRDRHGVLRSLYARDISGGAAQGQKYLLLKGTRKDDLIALGLEVALSACRLGEPLVVTEGAMDAVVPQAAGMRNVVALMGSCAELRVPRLRRLSGWGVQRIVLVPDADPSPQPCDLHERAGCDACSPGAVGAERAVRSWLRQAGLPDLYVLTASVLRDVSGAPGVGAGAKVDPASLVLDAGVTALADAVTRSVHAVRFLAHQICDGRLAGGGTA